MKNNSNVSPEQPKSYNFWKDKKIIGTTITIAAILMFVFGMLEVPFISSIPRYSVGMFFGYFSGAFYFYFVWVGLKMVFPDAIKLPKWLKINSITYWIVVLSTMLITEAWGWASTNSHIVKVGAIGKEPWNVSFNDWYYEGFTNFNTAWAPQSYWGGIIGSFIWSFTTMVATPIGSGILGAICLGISISLVLTGSFVGLYKNVASKRKLELKEKEAERKDISIAIDEEINPITNPVSYKKIKKEEEAEVYIPFEDPFADSEESYEKIRSTEVFSIVKEKNKDKLKKEITVNQDKLDELFKTFNIDAYTSRTIVGPTLTKYIVAPGPGINLKKFAQLESNIKMALAARDIRMELPIPGQSAIGIEVPNANPQMVSFKEIYDDLDQNYKKEPLAVALGKTVVGKSLIIPINKTPHLLVAGATGSGKSVGINAMLVSLLMRNDPKDLGLILVDPKMVEFTPYNDAPHLWTPVITDPIKAAQALEGLVDEMERRFKEMSKVGVRNLEEYNEMHKDNKWAYVVVVIDELADLMNVAAKLVETSIQRITQKARAAGIHLIVATQRPSVNVVTGTIKANIPSRISFSVTSSIDSKVILDETGAEKLMGKGDMLISLYGQGVERSQAAFISNKEIQAVINKVKKVKPAENKPDLFAKFKTKEKKDD